MINLISFNNSPLKIEVFNNSSSENIDALFLWEDYTTKIPQHSEIIKLYPDTGYFSGLNKGIDFFNNDIIFKVIRLDTYEIIFTHIFKNLSFINGKNILYISQNNHSGYSYSARNYIFQLLKNDFKVHWLNDVFDKSTYKPCNEEESLVFQCENKYDPSVFYDSVIIHHVPDGWNVAKKYCKNAKRVYGLTTWETTHLHSEWVNFINTSVVDEVIVPSNFNKKTFIDSGVYKNINVWHHDVFSFVVNDKLVTSNVLDKFYLYKDGTYLSSSDVIKPILDNNTVYYNISQYNERKNINQVISSFCKKFTSDDNVCLFIKTYFKEFITAQKEMLKYKFSELLNNFDNIPPIIFCFENLTDDEVNLIHEFGDVYFTLNRGEGFGLCTYTAKKIGNRIICGKFGAEKEFLSNSDSLIDYSLESPFNMEVYHNWYNDDRQKWAVFKDKDVLDVLQYFPKTIKKKYNYK
jgi:hypothetical protein